MLWRKKKGKEKLNDNIKGMITLDTFFKSTEIRNSEALYFLRSFSSSFSSLFSEII